MGHWLLNGLVPLDDKPDPSYCPGSALQTEMDDLSY
uniref:Uncharacterized protein n=1 Tax=Arundo donax TaxID=35708 RepID=A0A0A8YE75_ARUDO